MKYCPIMTIGFAPPKTGEKDARKCKKDCAWFDADQEECRINLIYEALTNVVTYTADTVDMLYETLSETKEI